MARTLRAAISLYGIPVNVVHGNSVAKIPVIIDDYASESDLIDVPMPANPVLEGDYQNGPNPVQGYGPGGRGDSHLIIWDEDNNIDYEFFYALAPCFHENADGNWHADQESVWNMNTNTFRTIGWTSADAAGLPILAGLVRPDEALPVSQGGQGAIDHAILFTLQNSIILDQYLYPAEHTADPGNTDASDMPPMGIRLRLKASVDISYLSPEAQIIAQAMKDYGLILADNGSNLFITGASYSVNANNQLDLTWNDSDIQSSTTGLKSLTASDFEVVDLTPVVTGLNTSSGPAGTTVTIVGQNFSGAAGHLSVLFGGTPSTAVTVVDDSHVTAVAPAGTGTVDVRVQSGVNDPDPSNINNPIFGYGTSAIVADDKFTYTTSTLPAVTAVSPGSGPTLGGTAVTIVGVNFTGVTAVKFGAVNATAFTIVSPTSITATAPAGAAGAVDVLVTTAAGTSITSAADRFTYVAAPTVTAVSPGSGPASGGTLITITGTNFTGASAVKIGGSNAASFTIVSATSITATVAAGTVGTIDVTVTTAGGTSTTSAADRFTYLAALPPAPPPPPSPPPPPPPPGPSVPSPVQLFAIGADVGAPPEVKVYDASTGQLRLDFYAFTPFFTGGVRVATGDINGDGVPDIVATAGPGGLPEVRVFDGRTGTLIRDFLAFDPSFSGGLNVACGDLNGDGRDDIVVAMDAGGMPLVRTFSGADGSTLAFFFAYAPSFSGGVRVAAGDVNGDGYADIITVPSSDGAAEVRVFSGRDGSLLADYFAFTPLFTGGASVAAGDLNGAGRADIIVGAGLGGPPEVKAFEGDSTTVLSDFFAFDPVGWSAGVRVGAVSLNGRADVVVTPGPGQAAEARVLDGLTLAIVQDFFAFDPAYHGSAYVELTGRRSCSAQQLDQPHQEHIRRQHQEGRDHHPARGGPADPLGAAGRLQAEPAAGDAHQVAEDHRLQRGRHHVLQAQAAQRGTLILGPRHVAAHQLGREAAPQRQVADEHRQQRQGHHAGQHARRHQLPQRRQAQHLQGVDLLGQAHRAQLGARLAPSGRRQSGRPPSAQTPAPRPEPALREEALGVEALEQLMQVQPDDHPQRQAGDGPQRQRPEQHLIQLVGELTRLTQRQRGRRQRACREMSETPDIGQRIEE